MEINMKLKEAVDLVKEEFDAEIGKINEFDPNGKSKKVNYAD